MAARIREIENYFLSSSQAHSLFGAGDCSPSCFPSVHVPVFVQGLNFALYTRQGCGTYSQAAGEKEASSLTAVRRVHTRVQLRGTVASIRDGFSVMQHAESHVVGGRAHA